MIEVDDTIILCNFAGLNGGCGCCGSGLKRVVGQVLAVERLRTRNDGKQDKHSTVGGAGRAAADGAGL